MVDTIVLSFIPLFLNSLISSICSLRSVAFLVSSLTCTSHFNASPPLPSSHTPNCVSPSRKRSVSLNCAISSSLGSSFVHGATPQHPRTPLGAFPGDPRSPLTGLAVMGVACICFTSEGVSRRIQPVGEGRGVGRGWGTGRRARTPVSNWENMFQSPSYKYTSLCASGVIWVSNTPGNRLSSLLSIHIIL